MRKNVLFFIGLFLILNLVIPQPSSCGSQLTINRGCGATYYPGEVVIIGYMVTASAGSTVTVTLKDILADGTVNVFFANRSIQPNVQYYASGVVAPPYGTETLTLEWSVTSSGLGTVGMEKCTFTVASSGNVGSSGSGNDSGTILRVESNVSNFQVWWNGVYNHTTPYDYAMMYSVSSGTHTVTLKKSGCTDASKTITLVPGIQNTVTINMSCGTSGNGKKTSDTDGDGVPDDQDSCYNPDCNIVDSTGCPRDYDRDGLNDCEDDCPTEKGTAANEGCPVEEKDRDGDGVSDDEDYCYNPGCSIVDSRGCPEDSDSDGIDDCEDDCPQEYGEQGNNGCPEEDSDNDGVADDKDNCYNPGCTLVDSRGCPFDSDNDGLNDCEDNCPNQSGSWSNNGCPSSTSSISLSDLISAFIQYFFVFLVLIAIIGAVLLIWKRKQRKKPVYTSKTRIYDDDTRIY